MNNGDVELSVGMFCCGHAFALIDFVAEQIGFKNIPSIMAIAHSKEVISSICTCPPVMAALSIATGGSLFDPDKDELTDDEDNG